MKAWRNDPLRFDAVRARYVRRLGCAAFPLLAISVALMVAEQMMNKHPESQP